jgi:hypothetical protein
MQSTKRWPPAGSLSNIHVVRDARMPRLKQFLDLARERGVPVRKEDRAVLDKISVERFIKESSPSRAKLPAPLDRVFDAKTPCVVVLTVWRIRTIWAQLSELLRLRECRASLFRSGIRRRFPPLSPRPRRSTFLRSRHSGR